MCIHYICIKGLGCFILYCNENKEDKQQTAHGHLWPFFSIHTPIVTFIVQVTAAGQDCQTGDSWPVWTWLKRIFVLSPCLPLVFTATQDADYIPQSELRCGTSTYWKWPPRDMGNGEKRDSLFLLIYLSDRSTGYTLSPDGQQIWWAAQAGATCGGKGRRDILSMVKKVTMNIYDTPVK